MRESCWDHGEENSFAHTNDTPWRMLNATAFDRRRKRRVPGLTLRVIEKRNQGLFANSHISIWNQRLFVATPNAVQPAAAAQSLAWGRPPTDTLATEGRGDTESWQRREAEAEVSDGNRSPAPKPRLRPTPEIPHPSRRSPRTAAAAMARQATFDAAMSPRAPGILPLAAAPAVPPKPPRAPGFYVRGPAESEYLLVSAGETVSTTEATEHVDEDSETQSAPAEVPVARATQKPVHRDTIPWRLLRTVAIELGKLKRMYTTGKESPEKALLPHISLVSSGAIVALAAVSFLAYRFARAICSRRNRRRY